MERIWKAFLNSVRAWRRLIGAEAAFQQEVALFAISLPLAWLVAESPWHYLVLTGSVLGLVIVEVLNTGIEAACDAVSREFNADIQLAKDCGSLAVLLACVLVGAIWLLAIIGTIAV